jgi:hypothetical protein
MISGLIAGACVPHLVNIGWLLIQTGTWRTRSSALGLARWRFRVEAFAPEVDKTF